MAVTNFDGLLTQFGHGRWTYIYFIGNALWGFIMPFHYLEGIFVAPSIDHECNAYDAVGTEVAENFTLQDLANLGLNVNRSMKEMQCSMERDIAMGVPTDQILKYKCHSWTYDNTTFRSTMTSEFDLVCDRSFRTATYQSAFQIGSLCGSVVNSLLADRLGRRTMIWTGSLMFSTLSIISYWITSYNALENIRYFIGMTDAFLIQTSFNFAMEVCQPRSRSIWGMVLAVPWAVGTAVWGLLAYFVRDWRYLQLVISLPTVLTFPILWLYDESPRWLIVRDRRSEAKKVLKRAARLNRATVPEDEELDQLMDVIQEAETTTSSTKGMTGIKQVACHFVNGILVLFRTPNLRRVMLVLYIDFFVVALVFVGLSLNGTNYSNNIYAYVIIMGIVEIPAYTLTVPFVAKVGRRLPMFGLYLLCGVSLILLVFIPSDISWLVMTLAQLGKFAISAAFQILYFYGTELIPTDVRVMGFASAAFVAKLGDILAPFITELLTPIYHWAPSIIFGVGSIIASGLTLLLPETLNVDLPDTVADLEAIISKKSKAEAKKLKEEEGAMKAEETV